MCIEMSNGVFEEAQNSCSCRNGGSHTLESFGMDKPPPFWCSSRGLERGNEMRCTTWWPDKLEARLDTSQYTSCVGFTREHMGTGKCLEKDREHFTTRWFITEIMKAVQLSAHRKKTKIKAD